MSAQAPSRIVVHPGGSLSGSVTPPGDKSITHRAYILGGLAEGETRVDNPNPGADCESTLGCLEALGARVERESGRTTIHGSAMAFRKPARVLDCGNSGTTMRLLAGPLAAQPFASALAGDASLNRRPMDRIIEPLRLMGASLRARDGDRLPPLEIEGGPLRSIDYPVKNNSAQVTSCVLLAGLFAPGTTTAWVSHARDHTQRMLPAFGANVSFRKNEDPHQIGWSVAGPVELHGTSLRVANDFSAAAFFLAAAAATEGASVTARGVSLNPTRTGLLTALGSMGAEIIVEESGDQAGEPIGNVTVIGGEFDGLDDPRIAVLMPSMIDEIPALAIAATRARGWTRITGASELRVKESDRVSALAGNLRRLGIEVEERPDGLDIRGGPLRGGEIDAQGDHRIAMAFAVAGLFATGPVTITGAREIATSFPGFVATLRDLGAEVEVPEEALPR